MSYFRKLFQTGAVRKTPQRVIRAILGELSAVGKPRILEFGAGKGEITFPLADQMKGLDPEITAFEFDPELGSSLVSRVPGVRVLYQDAFKFTEFIENKPSVDYIICALPLSFFPARQVRGLFNDMSRCLRPGGKAIIIFNAVWLIPTFFRQLPGGRLRIFLTLPVYLMYTFEKSEATGTSDGAQGTHYAGK
ncbi:MAG: class I SAM-dependent methyltransferase [Chitinophagaceae bacterium]|nr:MAG: class I SAM-dependent methyltransferase [Chitinophagaceae bacterium]